MPDNDTAPLATAGLAAELAGRHAKVTAWLRERQAACLVAIRDHSITYLTGYTTMTWKMYSRPIVAILTADGRLVVVAAETEIDSVRLRVPGVDARSYVELRPVPADDARLPDGAIQFAPHAAEVLGAAIEDAGPGPVAVDGLGALWPPIGQLTHLVPGLDARTTDASNLLWELRLCKSEWELDRMRAASRALDKAHAVLRGQIRPGMTEREIARRFSVAQLEAGAHEVGPFGVVAGPSRGLFGFHTEKVWERDELLYVDGAAIVDGYWSDYCRTYAARPVRPAERDGYNRVLAGLRAGVDAGRAGVTAGELGALMSKAMDIAPDEVGFGRFGHGIGLHVPEPPSLHADDPTPLDEGFMICVEPAVLHDGTNYVVEEEHLVTATGMVRVSPTAPDTILTL